MPAPKNKNLNPKDFVVSKKKGEIITKQAGTINGEQFNIEECEDCDIFLLDHIAQVFIDECSNCRIFVGPVMSSVFLRNCNNCDLQIACQQFRSRDCVNCRIALMCTTEPIIETSQEMQFACFQFGYFSLRSQLHNSRLKMWNNKWWQIHDFNKNDKKPNWSLLPQDLVPQLLRAQLAGLSAEELQLDDSVPLIAGPRARRTEESCIVFFVPNDKVNEQIEALLAKAAAWQICRGRTMVLGEEQLRTLLPKEPAAIKASKGKDITGIEFCDSGIIQQVMRAMDEQPLSLWKTHIHVVAADTTNLGQLFFESWKDEI